MAERSPSPGFRLRYWAGMLLHRTTVAYMQGPVFVCAAILLALVFDPDGSANFPAWGVPTFLTLSLLIITYTTERLHSGRWSLSKWADRMLVICVPAAAFYGYAAFLLPAYFIVFAIAILAAGLPLFGFGKNRLWVLWFLTFSVIYGGAGLLQVFADIPFRAPTGGEYLRQAPLAYLMTMAAITMMLRWLLQSSTKARQLSERGTKHLIQARKNHRKLDGANQALRAQRERMDRELKIARRIQESILPDAREFERSSGANSDQPARKISVGARYLALEGIGGDYYDFIDLGDHRYGFFIADVSGHGVPAALVTTMTKVAFTNHARGVRDDPARVLTAINAELYEFVSDLDHYLTACYLIVDLARGTASYANGGHTPLVLHRRGPDANTPATVEEWTTPESFFLGVEPEFQYYNRTETLQPGDRILLYTDGLTEMQNAAREFYGDTRLNECLRDGLELNGEELLHRLLEDLHRFSENRALLDDIAVVCIDYHDQNAASAHGA